MRKKKVLSLTLIVSLLFTMIVFQGLLSTVNAAGSFTISGYVAPNFIFDSSTAAILKAGFNIELTGVTSTKTDNNGYFEFTNVQGSSNYSIKISKSGYITREISNLAVNSNVQIGSQSSPIQMIVGDGNGDGTINMADIILIAQYFNTISDNANYKEQYDFNKDKSINMTDVVIIASHFSATAADYPPVSITYPTTSPTIAPTPTTTQNPTSQPTTIVKDSDSLTAAVAAAAPGTKILVGASIRMKSRIFINKGGITLAAAPGVTPVLDFDDLPLMTSTFDSCGIVVDSNDNTIDGLIVENAGKQGIVIHGDGNTLKNCISRYNEDTGIQISGTTDGVFKPKNNTVINCYSYRNCDTLREGGNADCFACKKTDPGPNNVFIDCAGWECSDDGWDLFDNNNDCTISNCTTWNNGDTAVIPFEGNGNGFKLGSSGCTGARKLNNCVAFDIQHGSAKGFDENNGFGTGLLTNCVAFNCTTDYKLTGKTLENCYNNTTTSASWQTEVRNKCNAVVSDCNADKIPAPLRFSFFKYDGSTVQPSPTSTPTVKPTGSATSTPTATKTSTPTATKTSSPTSTPTPSTSTSSVYNGPVSLTPIPTVAITKTINVGGSSSTTFESAVSSATSGTKIIVSGSVTSKSVKISSGIVISGTNTAVINFTGSSSAGISISGSNNTFSNIEITKAGDNGVHISGASASKNCFIDCKFTNNGDSGVQVDNDANNNIFIRCYSSGNFDTGSNGGNADGFAVKLHCGAGNAFDSCIAEGNSDDGWDFYAAHGVVKLFNCIARSNGKADGNGNGFKVGGVDNKTSGVDAHIDPLDHILVNCTSENNLSKGYDRNNNSGAIQMIKCNGSGNKAGNFSMPYSGKPSALGGVLTIFGKNCIIKDCTSINGSNDISGANLIGNCVGF
ncbi:MAG: right-handed parallel beta-helix repeat-containing protein [Bacillota bacterium]|nr:right-handed parallel beta-helix repeat-containing protein [Bacillota bacterium]